MDRDTTGAFTTIGNRTAVMAALVVALVACGGGAADDIGTTGSGTESPPPTGTATATAEPTSSPTPTPTSTAGSTPNEALEQLTDPTGEPGEPQQEPPQDQEEQQEEQPEQPAEPPTRSVTVEAGDNFFDPSGLSGEPGQTLDVTLRNVGEVQHTFTVESQGVDVVLDPGQEATVQVTVADGSTPFKCRFHSGFGMTGTVSG